MSLPEVLLWNILRQRPGGLKFRRQHPVGPYVIDFYCLEHRMALEIDGIAHDMGDGPQRDLIRDEWLKSRQIAILHIAASDVLHDTERAAQSIVDFVDDR